MFLLFPNSFALKLHKVRVISDVTITPTVTRQSGRSSVARPSLPCSRLMSGFHASAERAFRDNAVGGEIVAATAQYFPVGLELPWTSS
jgi:hypothetical protein